MESRWSSSGKNPRIQYIEHPRKVSRNNLTELQCKLEQCKWRIIFMSMFKDIVWRYQGNTERGILLRCWCSQPVDPTKKALFFFGTEDLDAEKKEQSKNILQENGTSSHNKKLLRTSSMSFLTSRFHVTHYGGCAILFNKDTFFSDITASSREEMVRNSLWKTRSKMGQDCWTNDAQLYRERSSYISCHQCQGKRRILRSKEKEKSLFTATVAKQTLNWFFARFSL